MFKQLLALLVLMSVLLSPLHAATENAAASNQVAKADVVASPLPPSFNAEVATHAFMNRLSEAARSQSDDYAAGGYWLQLWNLLLTLAISWFLLASGVSARMRDFAERKTSRRSLQVLVYALAFIVFTALISFPLTWYETWFREHQYGLSNLSLADWFMENLVDLGVNLLLMGAAIAGLYVILRRVPQTWWAWGTLASAGFFAFLAMVNPVFIAPLFNTYKPLPEGPVREEILSMARANGIPAENVYYFDASKQSKRISANVSGLFGTTRISLNDNLLNRTSPAEIRAVMAHEMGHYVLNHSLKHTIAFSLLMLGGFLFLRWSWDWTATRYGTRFGVRGIDDPAGLPLLVALFSVFFFLATPVSNLIIRTAEVEADYYGLNASREPDGFAEAIFKLAEYRKLEPGALEEAVFYHHPSGYQRILTAMRWKAEHRN